METRWDHRGWWAGLLVGLVGSTLALVLAAVGARDRLGHLLFGLPCLVPAIALVCGVIGMWVGLAVRVFKGRDEEAERALEVAMDEHDELAQRWGEDLVEDDEPTSTDRFAPDLRPDATDLNDRVIDRRQPPG